MGLSAAADNALELLELEEKADKLQNECVALKVENRKAKDEKASLVSQVADLELRLNEAEAASAISCPRARLWWQRGRLKITRNMLRRELADAWAVGDDLQRETERLKEGFASESAKVTSELETTKKALEEEKGKNAVLAKALRKQSDAVTAMQKQQSDLMLAAREATLKARTIQAHMETGNRSAEEAQSALEGVRSQLNHAKWQVEQAKQAEAALRNELYHEEIAHAQARDALDAAGAQGGGKGGGSGSGSGGGPYETDTQLLIAAKAIAEASALASASEQLASDRLEEAATARAERGLLEARVATLERDLRRASRVARIYSSSSEASRGGAPYGAFGSPSASRHGVPETRYGSSTVPALRERLMDLMDAPVDQLAKATTPGTKAASTPARLSPSHSVPYHLDDRSRYGSLGSPMKRLTPLGSYGGRDSMAQHALERAHAVLAEGRSQPTMRVGSSGGGGTKEIAQIRGSRIQKPIEW